MKKPSPTKAAATTNGQLSGYLSKQNPSKWKRRRWHQRWFVLDRQSGVLSYYKYASTGTIRHDAHGSLLLKGTKASMTIQGDLPRGTPTPFCFTIAVGSKILYVCADTEQEFRMWTEAISSTISQDVKTSDIKHPNVVIHDSDTMKRNKDLNMYNQEKLPKQQSLFGMLNPSSFGIGTLLVLNPIVALIRYGTTEVMYATVILINVYLVWNFWLRKPIETRHAELQQMVIVDNNSVYDANEQQEIEQTIRTQLNGTVNGSKAVAGCSLKKCLPDSAEVVAGCWTTLDATRFNVRQGPNYRKSKLKAPSQPALLELVATDVYKTDMKVDNIGAVVDLPHSASGKDYLIINCQVPCYAPSNPLWGEKQGDGDGFNFVTYYVIPPHVREQIDSPNPSNPGIKLLKNFMLDESVVRDRLKAIGIVVNPAEQKLGRTERHLLDTYNGQPILTRPQHRFYRGDGYFEVDIDAHLFNYVARKGLSGVTEHFGNMVVDFGFVLEGQDDDELPEQILGCVRLSKVEVKQAPKLS